MEHLLSVLLSFVPLTYSIGRVTCYMFYYRSFVHTCTKRTAVDFWRVADILFARGISNRVKSWKPSLKTEISTHLFLPIFSVKSRKLIYFIGNQRSWDPNEILKSHRNQKSWRTFYSVADPSFLHSKISFVVIIFRLASPDPWFCASVRPVLMCHKIIKCQLLNT